MFSFSSKLKKIRFLFAVNLNMLKLSFENILEFRKLETEILFSKIYILIFKRNFE